MHEQQPNPNDTPSYPEESLQSLNAPDTTQLAGCIMAEYGSPCTDPETGQVTGRTQWISANQMLSFHLFSYEVNGQGTGYLLDVHEEGVSERRRYSFGTDDTIEFNGIDGQEPLFIPNQEVLRQEVTRYLRDRYAATAHAAMVEARFQAVFHELTSRFSVEHALDFVSPRESGNQYIPEACSTDEVSRLRARRRLYEIAKRARVYCKEESFNQALDAIVDERRETARQLRTAESNTPKLSDLIQPQPPKHRD